MCNETMHICNKIWRICNARYSRQTSGGPRRTSVNTDRKKKSAANLSIYVWPHLRIFFISFLLLISVLRDEYNKIEIE